MDDRFRPGPRVHKADDDAPTGAFEPADAAPPPGPRPAFAAWVRTMKVTRFFVLGGLALAFVVLPVGLLFSAWPFGRAVLAYFGALALWGMIASSVMRVCWADLRKALDEERERMGGDSGFSGLAGLNGGRGFGTAFMFGRGFPGGGPAIQRPPAPGEADAHWADATVVDDDNETR